MKASIYLLCILLLAGCNRYGDNGLSEVIVEAIPTLKKGNPRVTDSMVFVPFVTENNLTADNTVFYETVTVNGFVTATNSVFLDDLHTNAEIIILDGTQTESICVESTGYYYHPQFVCIRNGSVVLGDIRFEFCFGKVFVDSTSTICGTVISGKIITTPEYYEICQ